MGVEASAIAKERWHTKGRRSSLVNFILAGLSGDSVCCVLLRAAGPGIGDDPGGIGVFEA